jgi:excisionase family DNA binding protein
MTEHSYAGEVERVAYKLGEAAAAIGVHVVTMRKWINDGTVAARKVGNTWFVSRRELERLVGGDSGGARA